MGFSRQEYWSGLPFPSPVATFCQTSPPWPICLGWPHMAWTELDEAVVFHVIRLASCLWLWFQSICLWCPLSVPSLAWLSLTLDVGYLFTATLAKRSRRSLPWTWGNSSQLCFCVVHGCCSPWGRKESDTTEPLNWNEMNIYNYFVVLCFHLMFALFWFHFPFLFIN